MTKRSRDPATHTPLNAPKPPLEEKQQELEGTPSRDDKAGYIEQSDVDDLGEITPTDIYEGELEAGVNDDLPNDPESLELLTELELRSEETDDMHEAVEEGYTYVPPVDPPVVPDTTEEPRDTQVASGLQGSALDEPYDADHHQEFVPDEDETSARVREALRADSSTTRYADQVAIRTRDGIVTLRGVVDDIADSDNLIAVAMYVTGVREVVDRLQVRNA